MAPSSRSPSRRRSGRSSCWPAWPPDSPTRPCDCGADGWPPPAAAAGPAGPSRWAASGDDVRVMTERPVALYSDPEGVELAEAVSLLQDAGFDVLVEDLRTE